MNTSDTTFFNAPRRIGRKRRTPTPTPAPTLSLMSATYDPDFTTVVLTFDAEINTDEMIVELFSVNDAQFTGQMLRGITTTGLSANSVTIEMEMIAPASGSGVRLTVDAGNGIVAASDGSAWGGVTELALPFGS